MMLRRVSTALLLLAFLVGAFFVSSPNVSLGDPISASEISVDARDLQLVCPGSLYRSGGDSGSKVDSFTQQGTASLNGSFSPSGAEASLKVADLNGTIVGVQPSGSVAESLSITAEGTNLKQGSALLNANQLQLVRDDRAAGLLATPCLMATNEAWLLGADTSVGRESLLILNNPGQVNATVALELFGTSGKIATAGQGGISVPAQGSTVVPVASLAPGLQALVIHVLASSSSVTATLQQKTVRGLSAAGADLVPPSLQLENRLVIPGLFVRGAKDAAKLIRGSADFGDLAPVLRVFVPKTSKAQTTVTAQVIGASEKLFGTVVRQTLVAGTVNDIVLNGLQDGNYAVFIDADAPIRAAIRLSRTNPSKKPITDFTWLQATAPIQTPVALTVPEAGISKLSLANPNRSAVSVALRVNGSNRQLTIASESSVVVEVAKGARVELSGSAPVVANLIVDVDFTIANLPLVDYQNLTSSIKLLVR